MLTIEHRIKWLSSFKIKLYLIKLAQTNSSNQNIHKFVYKWFRDSTNLLHSIYKKITAFYPHFSK